MNNSPFLMHPRFLQTEEVCVQHMEGIAKALHVARSQAYRITVNDKQKIKIYPQLPAFIPFIDNDIRPRRWSTSVTRTRTC